MASEKTRKKTVIALMYDFDKTLSPGNMQEYGFIPNVGMTPAEFWRQSDRLATDNKMDPNLAYMYQMIDRASACHQPILRKNFVSLGEKIKFYPGVETWFKRINDFAASKGVKAEHYIISSGLREIIEGTPIYKEFSEVYACEFLYDENGAAVWPKNVVNYTTKTQFLFRINKGVLDISDNKKVNAYADEKERPVPFWNMIYFGDGPTDVPCMRLVREKGGYSICVYKKGSRDGKQNAMKLIRDGRADIAASADYSEGGDLEKCVFDMIERMAVTARINALKLKQEKAAKENEKSTR